jgi:hypothetical protein
LVVDIYAVGTFNSFTVTDSKSDTFTQKIQSIGGCGTCASTYIWTTLTGGSGSDIVTVGTGGATRVFGFTVMDYSNVLGFGITATDQQDSAGASATSSVTLTNTAGSGSAIVEDFFSTGTEGGGTSAVLTNNQGQTVRDSGGANPCEFAVSTECESTDFPAATTTFSLGIAQSWSGGVAPYPLSQSALELTGSSVASQTTVTQCFGNCGTPAVTLANTNSTHTVNFNQSITLFYEFQAPYTGFMVNVTTSLAKSLSSGFNAPFLAFYKATCPAGVSPGTSQCPFVQQLGGQTPGFAKGKVSVNGGIQYTFSSGDWIAVAVSAQVSGLDLNDTNTSVQMFQTSGVISVLVTQATVFNAASKIGLWTWLTGNIIGSLPPPTAISPPCAGLLDCIVPNLVFSFCTNLTPQCQNASALLWAVLLSVFFSFFIWKGATEIMPGTKLPLGDIFMLMLLVWIFVMAGLTLIFVWVPIFFFFVISLVWQKHNGSFL